jgi:two-component system NtrC family response regulator
MRRSRPIALIVDDDVEITDMTAMALGSQGWLTIPANTPLEAASIARDLPIDLLVTDLDMPGMSGIELAALVRAQRVDLPVVLVTGWPEAASLVIEPPFAYLRKPFRLHALFAAVTSLAGFGDGHRLA